MDWASISAFAMRGSALPILLVHCTSVPRAQAIIRSGRIYGQPFGNDMPFSPENYAHFYIVTPVFATVAGMPNTKTSLSFSPPTCPCIRAMKSVPKTAYSSLM